MARPAVVVVGAGASGLGCAIELADSCDVILVDRIPVTGGTAGWDNPTVVGCTRQAEAAGVRLRLGASAIRWDGHTLVTAEPGRFDTLAADQLFVAGGLRPATLAGLHVAGDRPAGIVPATVAEHLLQAGVRLWDTVVIVGDGPWARVVAQRARALGSRIVGLAEHADWADERLPIDERWSVVGHDRVRALRLESSPDRVPGDESAPHDVLCDGIVLAADPVPNRNVDGAVLEGAPNTTFVQPLTPYDPGARFESARRQAKDWFSSYRKASS